MAEAAGAKGAALDASAVTEDNADPRAAELREQRAQYVEQLEGEVAVIESKLSGWRDALAAKKAELKQARNAGKGDE